MNIFERLIMPDFYQQYFREYHKKTFSADMSSVLKPLAQRLSPGSRILDAGCGSGRDLLWLKERGFHVTGFERSPGLAELARKNAGCRVIEGDFELYDFSGLQADAIVLMGSLVHISHENLPQLFGNIIQALTPHGYMLVSLKEGTGKTADAHGRIFHLWQDAELREVFKSFGFRIADFLRQVSVMGTDEIWLAYILEKTAIHLRDAESEKSSHSG
jgi:SAM-dependent methyltransferase